MKWTDYLNLEAPDMDEARRKIRRFPIKKGERFKDKKNDYSRRDKWTRRYNEN